MKLKISLSKKFQTSLKFFWQSLTSVKKIVFFTDVKKQIKHSVFPNDKKNKKVSKTLFYFFCHQF